MMGAGVGPATPKVREDGHIGAGGVGRLKRYGSFGLLFPYATRFPLVKGGACCSHPKGGPGKRSCL